MFRCNSLPLRLLWKTKMTFHHPHRMRWDYHLRKVIGHLKKLRYSKILITIEDNKFTRDILVFPQVYPLLSWVRQDRRQAQRLAWDMNESKRKGVGLGKENILGEKNVCGRVATYQLKQTSWIWLVLSTRHILVIRRLYWNGFLSFSCILKSNSSVFEGQSWSLYCCCFFFQTLLLLWLAGNGTLCLLMRSEMLFVLANRLLSLWASDYHDHPCNYRCNNIY